MDLLSQIHRPRIDPCRRPQSFAHKRLLYGKSRSVRIFFCKCIILFIGFAYLLGVRRQNAVLLGRSGIGKRTSLSSRILYNDIGRDRSVRIRSGGPLVDRWLILAESNHSLAGFRNRVRILCESLGRFQTRGLFQKDEKFAVCRTGYLDLFSFMRNTRFCLFHFRLLYELKRNLKRSDLD